MIPVLASAPLVERVEAFVQWLFDGFKTRIPRGPKVINDALLGNQYFARHEVAVIDSPLIQRLKWIRQTGLVFQVFPSARHTRFEHVLGTATLAERCLNAIRDRASLESEPLDVQVDRTRGDLAELRLAALLHDVGHGLCSHASEQIYEAYTDIREFRDTPEYAKNSPGEILSYLMVQSPTFRTWCLEVFEHCKVRINLDRVAEMIVGKHADPDKYFLAQIVSSPYDADKLDYIARDSFYCGLALTVDLPRFYNMIATTKYRDYRILVLRNYVPLEQILFSKMTLFGSVYHHPKVKCLDHMLRSLVQHIHENGDRCALVIRGATINFAEPVQFLYPTDEEFFHREGFGDEFVKKMLARFSKRDLLQRCVEISRRTVKNWESYHRKQLIDLSRDTRRLPSIEREIYKRLPALAKTECNAGEVLLSVPPPPRIKTDWAFIQTDTSGQPEPIEGFFPVEQWTEAYSHNKWKSFVYCPAGLEREVRDAAVSVLRDELSLEMDVGMSDRACHVR